MTVGDPTTSKKGTMPQTTIPEPSPFTLAFDELTLDMTYTGGGRTITETDVVQFSALTGDRHPVHINAVWAANSMFGERIAHGLLLLSYAAGMLPLDPDQAIAMRGIDKVTFKRPVLIGDTISVEAKLIELTELDAATGLVKCRLSIKNQDGRRVAQAELELLWRRDAEDGPEDGAGETGPSAPVTA